MIAEIIKNFNKNFPELKVTKIIDYDENTYVIEAIKDFNSIDYNDPYYSYDKKNKKIDNFSPAFNIDKFMDAAENRTVYDVMTE